MWRLRYNYFNYSASFKTHMYWYMYSILILIEKNDLIEIIQSDFILKLLNVLSPLDILDPTSSQ